MVCDTDITLLESDSGHSLFSDYASVWGLVSHDWPFVSWHLL